MDPALLLLIPAGLFLWKRRADAEQAAAARGEDIGEQVAGFVADIAESDLMTGVQSEVADLFGLEASRPPPLGGYSDDDIRRAVWWYEHDRTGKEPGPIHAYGIGAVLERFEEIFGVPDLAALQAAALAEVEAFEALTVEEQQAAALARAEELGVELGGWGSR